MATVEFTLVKITRSVKLFGDPDESRRLTPTPFFVSAGDDAILVGDPKTQQNPQGISGQYQQITPARAGAEGAGQIYWIIVDALSTGTPSSSADSASMWPLLLLAGGLALLYFWEDA